ncbi:MAG: winged helix-turn-helix transcriptional regulator [Candidatus Lokiarchaeota archaeon]|nr:winged helix-turn-helix transcriptional regulator [Candidatus Lokiarchaeota archaeon]
MGVFKIDETDMELIQALWKNSRTSFNQLGKDLEISGNILKQRSEDLEKAGVFQYQTNPYFSKFGWGGVAFIVDIPKKYRDHYIEKLSKFQELYEIIFSLEERCAIIAILPFNSKEGVTESTINVFINKLQTEIADITIHEHYKLYYRFQEKELELKEAEIKLIRVLREDSRSDLNCLSNRIGLSKKTLSRYLSRFMEEKLIRHTITLQPNKIRNFVIHFLIIKFENDKILRKKIEQIKERIKRYLAYYILVDPPGVAFFVYSENLHEMERLLKELYMLSSIDEVQIVFPSSIIRFQEWKDLVVPLDHK